MTPTKIEGANRVFKAPKNWNAAEQDGVECPQIHVLVGPQFMQTAWLPSSEELEHMLRGSPVVMSIWGRALPPASLGVPPAKEPLSAQADITMPQFLAFGLARYGQRFHDALAFLDNEARAVREAKEILGKLESLPPESKQ